MVFPRMHRPRQRNYHQFLLDSLESRTLLSGDCLGWGGSGDHEDEHDDDHGTVTAPHFTSPTPISDLTGNPLAVNFVAGVKTGGIKFFSSAPDIATLTSASTPVKLCGYSVSIDWGDGSAPTRGRLAVDKTDPTLVHVKGCHVYQDTGDFNITITVTQTVPAVQSARRRLAGATATATGGTLSITSTAHVTQDSEGGLDIAATTGQSFTGPVGTFTLPAGSSNTDPASFTALIRWGDGSGWHRCFSGDLGTVTLNADGSYTVSGTHTYDTAGTYRITITIFQNAPAGLWHASHKNHGKHLGWGHSVVAEIFSTATVTDPAAPPPTT